MCWLSGCPGLQMSIVEEKEREREVKGPFVLHSIAKGIFLFFFMSHLKAWHQRLYGYDCSNNPIGIVSCQSRETGK